MTAIVLLLIASLATIIPVASLLLGIGRSRHARREGANLPSQASSPPSATVADRVRVTHDGFQPSLVLLGTNRRLVFRRIDNSCASVVVIPDFGLEKRLPLNVDVVVDLPPSACGEFTFQCSLGKHKGKLMLERSRSRLW